MGKKNGTYIMMLENDLHPGLYFIILESGEIRKSKKMVLI